MYYGHNNLQTVSIRNEIAVSMAARTPRHNNSHPVSTRNEIAVSMDARI